MQCYVRYDELQRATGLSDKDLQSLLGETPCARAARSEFISAVDAWQLCADVMLHQRSQAPDQEGTAAAFPILMRMEEAAKLCQISRTKLYEYVGSGRLASVRMGRSRRVTREAVLALVESLHAEAGFSVKDAR